MLLVHCGEVVYVGRYLRIWAYTSSARLMKEKYMTASARGEFQPLLDDIYPSHLLKRLLSSMMAQFGAEGAALALYDEHSKQMEARLHLRLRAAAGRANGQAESVGARGDGVTPKMGLPGRRVTGVLGNESPTPTSGKLKASIAPVALDECYEVSPQESALFPVGSMHASSQDLIGFTWLKNEPYILRQDEYQRAFAASATYSAPAFSQTNVRAQTDPTPAWFMSVPIQSPALFDDLSSRSIEMRVMGIVVLYQFAPRSGFVPRQLHEAQAFAERIALYLQNDQLRRAQLRTSAYMQRLQDISAAFPSTVKLAALVQNAHQFAANLADVSSFLITLYDRDSDRIYDVYAVANGQSVDGLPGQPIRLEDRPMWRQLTAQDRRSLLLSSVSSYQGLYDEVLTGVWGDQRQAGTFLFLPMKMFNRVIGSLSLTSMDTHAYHTEEIQVLETMAQIITVGIENVRLYERARQALIDAGERASQLAAMNSALQAISTVLNVDELLSKFVESAAGLVQAEMSVFFQLSEDRAQLFARAIYAPQTGKVPDGAEERHEGRSGHIQHADLIEMIRLPFKGSILESLVNEGFFYLDASRIDALAQHSEEGGAIFLRETGARKMLMIPVLYQTDLVGILAMNTPPQHTFFRPNQVGMLLAICAQVAGAIRNAQLFAEIQEANAELKRLDKLKDEFLVTASHELRTPLSAISGYASMLKRQSNRANPQPQNILRFANKISGAAQQLTDLVSSMTEASKIGTLDKRLDLQVSPVQMEAAIEIAINMLSVNVEQKLAARVDPNLFVQGDPLRVRQVITNLLDNATKYSPPHTTVEIIVAAMRLSEVPLPDDQVDAEKNPDQRVALVTVHDEGEGILPADQERVFEKFYRASRSLTTPIRGSGLGLYICRRYIEAMGGQLWVASSVPGEGSTFSFYLPQIDPPTETLPEPD